ncbi:hypothetical protein CDAR_586101 [Caerostris darwini]|uniref:Uncharacterized protein n=1 Tax=Caerostris darwini TaxID=1538125 RepID=A0AAV4UVV8_9ARAC|nr:hypothetical protein CDAR_586101 [Caerostris darwini]
MLTESSHPPEDHQEKFPLKVSNASANLWPKRVLNSTEASNSHSSGTHSVSGNDETNPLHEWPSLQLKLHPIKLCLGNAPLSRALIHCCGVNERIIKRRKDVYGGGDNRNDYTRDLGALGCSANDLFSSDRGRN